MLEQSLTGRTYTRDAYAPVRRDAHAKAEKIKEGSIPAPSHFSKLEESVLDRSAALSERRNINKNKDRKLMSKLRSVSA